jgi:hypothetical protein
MELEKIIKKIYTGIVNLSLPEWVVNNIVTALGKGIFGIIDSSIEIPILKIQNYKERIKLIHEIKLEAIKKASNHTLSKIESSPELAQSIMDSHGIRIFEEQLNKEKIALKAIENLKSISIQEQTSNIELKHDWLTTFWNLASTKSEDEIQIILGKILSNDNCPSRFFKFTYITNTINLR